MAVRIDRDRVVEAALTLLNQVGIDGLTMRALASALHIQAPSLYWHFPSKQELLEGMADAILSPVGQDMDTNRDFVTVLSDITRQLRQALLAYRDGSRVIAGAFGVTENVLRVAEITIEALVRAGIDQDQAVRGAFNLFYFVLGLAIEEQAYLMQSTDSATSENRRNQLAALAADRFPYVLRNVDAIYANDFEARFESGLATYLHGLPALRFTRLT